MSNLRSSEGRARGDDLPEDVATTAPPVPEGLILPRAEALIAGTRVDFRIGGNRAFYNPLHDFVQVPPPQAYFEPVNWHRTALHELGHATGHRSRLDRDMSGSFGSRKYAFEELVAEITAAFTCAARRSTSGDRLFQNKLRIVPIRSGHRADRPPRR